MKIFVRFASLAWLFAVGCADSGQPKAGEKKAAPLPSQVVGRVQSRPGNKQFILIESYGAWKVTDGTTLYSAGDTRTATLEITGERLGQFVAADIIEGSVEIGDAVIHRPEVIKKNESTTEGVESSTEGVE